MIESMASRASRVWASCSGIVMRWLCLLGSGSFRAENLFGQLQPILGHGEKCNPTAWIRNVFSQLCAPSGIQPVTCRNFTERHTAPKFRHPANKPEQRL